MKYEGYEELSKNCSDLFDRLQKDFADFAKLALRVQGQYIDSYELEDTMNMIFWAIIKAQTNSDEILSALLKCFNNNELLAKFVAAASMLRLVNNFARLIKEERPAMMHMVVYMTNAVQAFASNFGFAKDEDIIEKSENEQNSLHNTINLDGGGFNLYGDIFAELKQAQTNGASVTFLNLYKGVNIKSESKIISIDEQSVTFSITALQLEAIKKEGYAYIIKDENITSGLQASIISVDLVARTVTLGDFARSTKNFALMRKFPRVHPNKFTPVQLCGPNSTQVNGKLYDISQGGIGVISTEEAPWKHGDELRANFSLEIEGKSVDISLSLELVVVLNYQGSIRYCCKIARPQPALQDIARFSEIRVEQTINELRQSA